MKKFVAALFLISLVFILPGPADACLKCSDEQSNYCEDVPWWGVFELAYHECTIRTLCFPGRPCHTECWGSYQCTFWDIIF